MTDKVVLTVTTDEAVMLNTMAGAAWRSASWTRDHRCAPGSPEWENLDTAARMMGQVNSHLTRLLGQMGVGA